MHVHEGQTSDQPHDVDIVEDENNDRVMRVDDDKNDDAPDVYIDECQSVDQSPDIVEGDNNVNADVIEDNNNDSDGALPSSSIFSPQFNSNDPYKVLGVPTNATEWQIQIKF